MLLHWCIVVFVIVDVLNRRVGWSLLIHWRAGWCVESMRWLTWTDALTYWLMCWTDMLVDVYWCTDVLVNVLNRHVGWHLLADALTCWLMCWIDILVDIYWLMHWCVGWCVELTCWLTFTDALTYWLTCWVDMLVDVYWLMHWHVVWCFKWTCQLTFTDALTYWLMFESIFWLPFTEWCIDVLVGVLNRHVGWHLLMHGRFG